MFTKEELDVLLAFLDRVNVNGKEADSLVYLKNKIRTQATTGTKDEGKDKKKNGDSKATKAD